MSAQWHRCLLLVIQILKNIKDKPKGLSLMKSVYEEQDSLVDVPCTGLLGNISEIFEISNNSSLWFICCWYAANFLVNFILSPIAGINSLIYSLLRLLKASISILCSKTKRKQVVCMVIN